LLRNFCGTCNRLRITADGKLKVCLFGEEGFSFKEALRGGVTEEDLLHQVHQAILRKKFALGGHADANDIAVSNDNRPMILIGG
jgi:cyclic pyranopterin phosphate synthase